MSDVLCIGEALIVFSPIDDPGLVGAQTYDASLAGAEVNVATALASAGVPVEWAGLVGSDPFGERVVHELTARDIGASYVGGVDGLPTGVYFKPRDGGGPHYYRRGSAASTFGPADVDRIAKILRPRHVHVSGVAAQASEAGLSALRHLVGARPFGDATISFDVNFRAALASDQTAEQLQRLAALSDVVFVGRDEAATLWAVADAEQIRRLLPDPRWLVVKDADKEAVEFNGAGVTRVPANHVDVIEPTGAGDAFAAGWIAAFIRGLGPGDRLSSGHEYATRVLRSTRDYATNSGA
ncbi:sugar kinase [Microbacterium sulfonylureivorans]|uniref:sugar kinase n=1 Tax=Microbacterium sulfonylureivorans TaxID=2486854 RepID=UPI0013DEA8A6|nr:sugar kinase [Microbacterium sulfonylureivorans]